MNRTVRGFAAACVLILAGCAAAGDDVDAASSHDPGVQGDSALPDLTPEDVVGGDALDSSADVDAACPTNLGYVYAMEDPVNGYHVVMAMYGQRRLEVKVTVCDAAAKDVVVTFEEVQDDLNVCSLESAVGTTAEDGIASVTVSSPQDETMGDCKVKACLDPDRCLSLNIHVRTCGGYPPLVVGFEPYTGAYPQVNLGKVMIFRNAESGQPNCADLRLGALPTVNDIKGPISLTTTAQFTMLKDLETDLTQTYTVLCTAFEGGSTITRAQGCVDDVTVEWGTRTYVECPLTDIPPRIVGTYRIASTLDLVSGLPPNVAAVINFVIDFVAYPTSTVLKLLCDPMLWESGNGLQDLCTHVFIDPVNPDVTQLTSIGEIARTIINAHVTALTCPYPDNPELCAPAYIAGEGVGTFLRKSTLRSRMICSREPDSDGRIPLGGCREIWDTVSLEWMPGRSGVVERTLASLTSGGQALTPDIEVRLGDGSSRLAIANHKVDLRFGALIDWALEKILLPQVFGPGGDGLPPVDSFEAMIGSLLAGRQCLKAGEPPCCEVFAENLSSQSGGVLTVSLVEGACEVLVISGGAYIRKFLTDLDATPDAFSLGTPDGRPCAVFDTNGDMRYDALGRMSTSEPCEWDATLTLGQYDYKLFGHFHGSRE